MIDDSDYLCKNDNTQNEVTQNNMDTDNDVHTHYAGAELLVCDVQRVSAPVEPAARPVLRRPVPGQMGNLVSLRRTELLSPPPPTQLHLSLAGLHIYQGLMRGVELLQYLVHDGVCEIGDH